MKKLSVVLLCAANILCAADGGGSAAGDAMQITASTGEVSQYLNRVWVAGCFLQDAAASTPDLTMKKHVAACLEEMRSMTSDGKAPSEIDEGLIKRVQDMEAAVTTAVNDLCHQPDPKNSIQAALLCMGRVVAYYRMRGAAGMLIFQNKKCCADVQPCKDCLRRQHAAQISAALAQHQAEQTTPATFRASVTQGRGPGIIAPRHGRHA